MSTTATHARENEVTILAHVFGKERRMLSEEMARHIVAPPADHDAWPSTRARATPMVTAMSPRVTLPVT